LESHPKFGVSRSIAQDPVSLGVRSSVGVRLLLVSARSARL